LNTESTVWFIPYRDRVHQKINQRLDKFFILNIPILELLQPVYNQFLVQQGYLLFFPFQVLFKRLLFLLQH